MLRSRLPGRMQTRFVRTHVGVRSMRWSSGQPSGGLRTCTPGGQTEPGTASRYAAAHTFNGQETTNTTTTLTIETSGSHQ